MAKYGHGRGTQTNKYRSPTILSNFSLLGELISPKSFPHLQQAMIYDYSNIGGVAVRHGTSGLQERFVGCLVHDIWAFHLFHLFHSILIVFLRNLKKLGRYFTPKRPQETPLVDYGIPNMWSLNSKFIVYAFSL